MNERHESGLKGLSKVSILKFVKAGNFFCRDRYPQTDYSGWIWGDKNDGKIKDIGFISFFALELDFAQPRSKFFHL